MAFDNSVYNVEKWISGKSYSKNDIVARIEYVGGTASLNRVPRNIKYYYNLTGANTSTAPENDATNWGGYTSVNNKEIPFFLWKPSYNISTRHNPRVNVVQFGNGYEQRNPNGLFSQLITLDINFEKRTEDEARAIIHFLKARKAVESFAIKELPNLYADNTAGGWKKRFVCPTFNSNYIFYNNYSVTATFNQENN
jgi:phage-related protein